jgi:membrane protein DedA with SNARE-associated domain
MFDWILSIITHGGYLGIFFLMVAENIFPPIPSEIILPLAGFAAASGKLGLVRVIFVGTCGAVAGCLPWYVLGRLFGTARLKRLSARYGRAMTLSPDDIDAAREWFGVHGQKAVLFGRLIPTIRTLISIPAGIARMPLGSFLAYSFVGSAVWTTALVLAGYALESQYESVSGYVNLASDAVALLIVGIYIYRVLTFRAKDTRDVGGQPDTIG